MWRALRCPSKRGISGICCSRAFSACWVGEVYTQYFILKEVYRIMSLGLISRGYGLAGQYGQLFLHYWQTSFDLWTDLWADRSQNLTLLYALNLWQCYGSSVVGKVKEKEKDKTLLVVMTQPA